MDYKKQFELKKRYLQFKIDTITSDEQKLDQLLSSLEAYAMPDITLHWSSAVLRDGLKSFTLVWKAKGRVATLSVYPIFNRAVCDIDSVESEVDLNQPLTGALGAFLNQHCLVKSSEA